MSELTQRSHHEQAASCGAVTHQVSLGPPVWGLCPGHWGHWDTSRPWKRAISSSKSKGNSVRNEASTPGEGGLWTRGCVLTWGAGRRPGLHLGHRATVRWGSLGRGPRWWQVDTRGLS